MRIFPRNASIDNASKTINHGEDTNLTIKLNDLYDGDPIVNRTVHVTIKDKDGNIIKDYDVISDENSNILINVPNLDTGNYRVLTVFNSTMDYTNCSNVSSIEVIPSPKLNITKVLDTIQNHYIKGDEVEWTITVTNIGEITAEGVTVTDIAGYLTITDHTTDNGTFTDGVWSIGDLAVGDIAVLHITTIITGSNVVAWNAVNVTSTNYDNPYANKTNNVTVDVWPDANVTVNKSNNATATKVAFGDLVE